MPSVAKYVAKTSQVSHLPLRLLACAIASLFAIDARAQGVATDQTLQAVTVNGMRAPLDPNLPTTTESRTAAQLRDQNLVNVEDALKYLPDVTVRKRYIGDRNALIGGRSSSNLQAPRGLVYADGYLVSQFLGQFNAPRWNIVAPEELARIDVLYGPFSALYPGNSIGTTVVMTTRQPTEFAASARVQTFTQNVDDAGYSGTYSGHQESAWLGNKVGDWTYTIGVNQLHNKSQPMQYLTLQTPSTSTAAATPVTGAVPGLDPTGKPWYLAGPIGSAIEDNTQQQFKAKIGYDFSPTVYAEALYAYWHNEGKRTGESILRDANGNRVYAGLVSIDGIKYSIPAGSYSPQNVEEAHGMLGVTLKTKNKTGWNASAVGTIYDISTDTTRTATGAPPLAGNGGPGTLADNSGTGWKTLDLQSTYTPMRDESHALAIGFHSNLYTLQNQTFATPDWINGGPENKTASFGGKTSLRALFAQDTWKLSPQWLATFGLRYEQWTAKDGSRASTLAAAAYPNRSDSAWSPKLSVSWLPSDKWQFRGSVGKGVRFPTVAELFQGSLSGNTVINNNPDLKPETSIAKDLTAERSFIAGRTTGTLRATLFEDDVRDTIYSQTNVLVFPNVTNIQNIDRVRTRGVELSLNANDVAISGFDLTANISLVRAVIVANANNPATIDKTWVRVPRVRANLIAAYHRDDRWSASLAVRHSGRQYGNLDNSDINPDTYGGTSSYTVWDTKATMKIAKKVDASIGIDNLTNQKYYAFHPYPGRTIFGELRASF